MFGIYASAVVICLASLIVGQGLLVALGVRRASWLSPALGFAALLIVSRVAIKLPGRDVASLVADAVLIAGALAVIVRARIGLGGALRWGLPLGVLILALESIPFLANDRIGVFGVGVYSNDVAQHMFWADWLRSPFGGEPFGISSGYPIGPHSFAATVAEATGIGVGNVFIGLLLAVPVLTGWCALAALRDLAPGRRAVAAILVGLSYLGISYLAQGAFKETVEALLLVGFTLTLRQLVHEDDVPARRGLTVALGILLAAAVYNYGYPGLYWLLAAVGAWAGLELLIVWRRESFAAALDRLLVEAPTGALAGSVLLLLVLPEIGRVIDFANSGAVSYVQGQSGTLRAQVSPFEALGVWPTGNFRVHPASDLREAIGVAIGVAAVAFGFAWWGRRRDLTVPAAVIGAAVIYAGTRARYDIYVEAKALAVLAPVTSLLALRALLARVDVPSPWPLARGVLALAFVVAAAISSFLALRETPVGPREHGEELAELRPLLQGQPTAFFGISRFSEHDLAGVPLKSPGGFWVRHIKPRPNKEWFGRAPLDFDNMTSEGLDRFRFAISTRTSYQSRPPRNWRRVRTTLSFALWERTGPTPPRETLDQERLVGPGAVLECGTPDASRILGAGGRAAVLPDPVFSPQRRWRPKQFLKDGRTATIKLDLAPGRWTIAMQYHTPFGVILDAPGLHATLPANLDGQVPNSGQGPWYDVRTIKASGPITIEARPTGRSWAQRLLRVKRQGILGGVAAMRAGATERLVPIRSACGRYVDWYESRE